MKKIILFISIIAITLTGCAGIQKATNVVCSVAANICPVIGDLLNLGATVTVSPTNNAHQVLVSASGVTSVICDVLQGICPVVDSAIANGKTVSISPVGYSTAQTSRFNASGTRYVRIKVN